MTKDEQIKGMANLNRGSVGVQEAQPVQKPVACRFCHSEKGCWTWQCYHCGEIDDVQQPPSLPEQRPWVGLTDEDKQTAVWTNGTFGGGALWAEAMLKERNG
jgi:hypothetical protein